MRALPALAFALITLSTPTLAQEVATAKSGVETRVGWIGSLKSDCTANPAPEVRPAKTADHGVIKLTQGTVTTNQVPSCPNAKVPAIVVFYTSAAGYKGADAFSLSAGSGGPRTYSITVE